MIQKAKRDLQKSSQNVDLIYNELDLSTKEQIKTLKI